MASSVSLHFFPLVWRAVLGATAEWKGEAWASYTDELCSEEEIEKKE